jgi:hypothetical protein
MKYDPLNGNTAADDIIEGLLAALLDNMATAATVYPLLAPEDQQSLRDAARALHKATFLTGDGNEQTISHGLLQR